MPVVLDAKVRENVSDLSKSFNTILRRAMRETGHEWIDKVLKPKKFTPGARFAYKHRPRKKTTKKIKEDLGADPQTDNVQSGKTRRMAQHLAKVSVTTRAKGYTAAVVRVQVPSYIVTRKRGPDSEAEISATDPVDKRRLTERLDRSLDRLIEEHSQRRGPQ